MIVNIFVQFDEGVFHQNAGIGIQMGTNGTSLYSSQNDNIEGFQNDKTIRTFVSQFLYFTFQYTCIDNVLSVTKLLMKQPNN